MIIPNIVNEVVCRLRAITAYTESPAGHVYYYTPDAVYKNQYIADAEITDGPIYTVYRRPKENTSRNPDLAYGQWGIPIVVEGVVKILDFDDPTSEAEKCLVDIDAALCGAEDNRQRNTLSGTCQAFYLDGDGLIDSPPKANDLVVSFEAQFVAVVSAPRGNFNTLVR